MGRVRGACTVQQVRVRSTCRHATPSCVQLKLSPVCDARFRAMQALLGAAPLSSALQGGTHETHCSHSLRGCRRRAPRTGCCRRAVRTQRWCHTACRCASGCGWEAGGWAVRPRERFECSASQQSAGHCRCGCRCRCHPELSCGMHPIWQIGWIPQQETHRLTAVSTISRSTSTKASFKAASTAGTSHESPCGMAAKRRWVWLAGRSVPGTQAMPACCQLAACCAGMGAQPCPAGEL